MSERAQGKGSSGLGIGLGIAAGCGLGCVVLLVAAGGFAWYSMRSITQQMEAMAQQVEAAAAVQREVAALDETHPPRLTADLAELQLSPADLDAYETVRDGVDPVLVGMAESRERMERLVSGMESNERPDFSQLMTIMREAQGTVGNEMESRNALAVAVRDSLTAAQLGPTDLTRLLEVVEWHFLERPAAASLALPSSQRWELESQRERVVELGRLAADPNADPVTIRLWLEDEGPPDASAGELRQRLRKELAAANGKLGELEAAAAGQAGLSEATRLVLEARRPELEARALPELGPLLEMIGAAEWASSEGDREDEPGNEESEEPAGPDGVP